MKELIVIDRAKWRTGGFSKNQTGTGSVELKNENGFMCCLGFICSKKKVAVKGIASPNGTNRVIKGLSGKTTLGFVYNTKLTQKAIDINDNRRTTPQEKEKQLIELFNKNPDSPYKLKFKGKYV